jgi:hypothetical protein
LLVHSLEAGGKYLVSPTVSFNTLKGVNLKLVLTFLEKIKEFNLLFLIYYF